MIKKSLLCFVLLCGLHSLVVALCPHLGRSTHQWQENVIRTQAFLFSPEADTVMVGTSLSARILADSIPSVSILSFSGCAVEDGLALIGHRSPLPRYVLVESNLLLRKGNPQIFASQTNSVLLSLRRRIPSLRERYAPVCLLSSLLRPSSSGVIKASTGKAADSLLLQSEVERRLREESSPMKEEAVEQQIAVLHELINSLEQRGVRFVFFEMPVNERLRHMESFEKTRAVFEREFPRDRYPRLAPDTTNYQTTDGLHLSDAEQLAFSHYFSETLHHTDLASLTEQSMNHTE